MQYSASPARRHRLSPGRAAAGCDSQPSRPLRYLDLLVSLVVAQCFAEVFALNYFRKKEEKKQNKGRVSAERTNHADLGFHGVC